MWYEPMRRKSRPIFMMPANATMTMGVLVFPMPRKNPLTILYRTMKGIPAKQMDR